MALQRFDWTESKGGCWARLNVHGHEVGVPKPLPSAHLPLYDMVGELDVIADHGPVAVTVFEQITSAGWIWHPGIEHGDEVETPRPTRALSGMFVFTLGRWNHEVRQDPEHLYTGEELALSIRSFTHGYDLFNPSRNLAWHRHHPGGNRKFIHDGDDDEVAMRHERACKRLRALHRGDPDRALSPSSIGTAAECFRVPPMGRNRSGELGGHRRCPHRRDATDLRTVLVSGHAVRTSRPGGEGRRSARTW